MVKELVNGKRQEDNHEHGVLPAPLDVFPVIKQAQETVGRDTKVVKKANQIMGEMHFQLRAPFGQCITFHCSSSSLQRQESPNDSILRHRKVLQPDIVDLRPLKDQVKHVIMSKPRLGHPKTQKPFNCLFKRRIQANLFLLCGFTILE